MSSYAYNHQWYLRNRERILEHQKMLRTGENAPEYKITRKAYRLRLRMAAIDILGGKCVRCGFSDNRALQIDHINGGGIKDVRNNIISHYLRVVKSITANEKKYQLLCANCNWIKRVENNEIN